ncbi:MAG: hypothetical protein QOE41_838, partial [Mycobacterium sp.]|nr:hypothetical protein [Mycobacterium sp.]
ADSHVTETEGAEPAEPEAQELAETDEGAEEPAAVGARTTTTKPGPVAEPQQSLLPPIQPAIEQQRAPAARWRRLRGFRRNQRNQ